MVKARFPGKPSKHFNRRKVPAVNSEENEGINAAEDVYRRLSVFYSLFQTEDEDNNFHGFSPHDNENKSPIKNSNNSVTSHNKKRKVHFSPKKLDSSKTSSNNASPKERVDPKPEISTTLVLEKEFLHNEFHSEATKNQKQEDNPLSNPTLSGKFVLPSRSAHSSRVIKPNKRFLQNDVSPVPCKKSRLLVVPDVSNCNSQEKPYIVNSEKMRDKYSRLYKKSDVNPSSLSPVKFVLRKPRLKIKSQPLSTVGGPFSSPSASSLTTQGLRHQSPSVTKVFCGVCGSLRTYRYYRQARKFGIFSCDPCRKFILRIIRSDRQNLLQPLVCSSGNGNCPIRHNSLITQCFSTEELDKNTNKGQERCEACWLSLCLRSFHMPQKLTKRLSSFLPSQVSQKPVLVFNKCHTADWSEISNSLLGTTQNSPELRLNNNSTSESRIIRRNKGIRENINIRRGSSASLRLSSHRSRGLRDYEEVKRGRGRQKLPVAGPRVKHVCRSASVVLGQPVATFDSANSAKDGSVLSHESHNSDFKNMEDRKAVGFADNEGSLSDTNEKNHKPNIVDSDPRGKQMDIDYPPVARMLQDLGRANCELLDGMENHELERLNAKVSIDFWESYDPEEVSQMGFPLIGYNPLRLKALCFLCGSAGLEKMVHCASCCEPYHTFCVPNLNLNPSGGDWWRLDWLCPKCTQCEICLKSGGTQLSCTKCQKSYHFSCISTARANISDKNWVCPSCLYCKSCNDSNVHVFVGNMPLCKACFKLRKKGNFCPLCQCCYDDNDYNTKMMECAECKCWIHAQCEGISNEKYQVLSYLPSSIEFICRLCCKNPPAPWSLAVNNELKAGYLNVIKVLSKNKNACAMFKASPKKQRVCVCLDKHRNPIHLPNLLNNSDTESLGIESDTSPERDYKSSDLGLLTPKLTKDDEESLKTVKTDFLNLVNDKDATKIFNEKSVNKKSDLMTSNKEPQLLRIVYDKLTDNTSVLSSENKFPDKSDVLMKEKLNSDFQDRVCTCKNLDSSFSNTLSLLAVKHKASSDEYHSVCEFHRDMECVVNEIANSDLSETYNRCLKQIFPWFDPLESRVNESLLTERETIEKSNFVDSPKLGEKQKCKKKEYSAMKGLLNLEQENYYIGLNIQETRICLFCKSVGEGFPTREGRLLYCGHNEWVHTNCALWSNEVFEEIDGSLQNVQSAVSRARLIRCFHCGKKGASLGCCSKSCPLAYHFICAMNAECVFLESKEVYCKTHSNQRGEKEIHKDEDFHIKRSVYVELDHKKKKDVLRSEVRIYIGSLEVSQVGEILPDLSDDPEVIIPCEYKCSRLYWSCKEPWKIVRYSIRTRITNTSNKYSYENDTNYTVDHSLEFTPPPSPIESINSTPFVNCDISEKEIKMLVNQIIDNVCSKEEEGNFSDQQTTDLLPPDLKDAIFNELPQDFLDRISVHDIFTKMSFDDGISELRGDKSDLCDSAIINDPFCNKLRANDCSKDRHNKTRSICQVVRVVKPKTLDKIKDCEVFIDREKVNKWKRQSIIQVDGAMDLSESDQSNDSCDINLNNSETFNGHCDSNEDKPVKCARCHRTYRTSISYDRHLSTCNADFSSCSDSDLSEEEKTQGLPDETSEQTQVCHTDMDPNSQISPCNSQPQIFNVPFEVKSITTSEHKVQALVQNSFENSIVCVNSSDFNGIRESSESVVNINYSALNNDHIQTSTFPNEQTLVTSVDSVVPESVLSLPQSTIILQQVPNENVLPTAFMSSSFQEPQQPNIQYITAINTQEKTQFLTTNSMGSGTFHIQPQIPQSVVQNVPTVLGTIVQPNGVEQIVLNNPGSSLDVYGHQQNNMYITNTPMIVGMETVVSNTVMSSSRFITGATPGMLASSYSATTTQVFQAAKPVIDIPQSYVVLNTNSPIVESNGTCVQNIMQNGTVPNSSWNGYKISYQDALKLNKNITYQTMSQQILTQKQDLNGVKIINPNEHINDLILLAPAPPVKFKNSPDSTEKLKNPSQGAISSNYNGPIPKPSNLIKVVELPSSSAVHKEKPQQAVAPVVIKKISEPPKVEEAHQTQQPIKINFVDKIDPSHPATLINNVKNTIITPQNTSEHSDVNTASEDGPCKKQEKKVPIPAKPKDNALNKKSSSSISKGRETSSENSKKRKLVHEEPKISFEITSDDGFSYSTTSLHEAWNTVFETVQKSRKSRGLPLLTQNPFSSPDTMLKKLMGLGNNSMKYILEQLPGISSCSKYKPVYHKKMPSALEKELFKGGTLNPSGCARTEKFRHTHKTYDMFSWLASRHRRPPKLLNSDTDGLNGNSRRATSMNLPMAMRFRHLKETSKLSVGVFRSDIHGRGLFCLRDIDSGEMVIEYAGEVIRSALTDKRERHYTEKGIGCYMFRIDDKFVVDATMKGNAARFINHSCEPNCYSRVIDVLGKKHILIFALRKILQGEELTYDYKFPLEEDKINCHCLSRKCRKYLN